MLHIFDLPSEILEEIVLFLPLLSIPVLAQTCRTCHQLVYNANNNHLWRTMFFIQDEYDDPREVLGHECNIRWDRLLQKWTSTRLQLTRTPPKPSVDVLHGLLDIINHAVPYPNYSLSLATVSTVLEESGILDEENGHYQFDEDDCDEYTQLIYRLKVYTGWKSIIYSPEERLRARCYTYNLRNYNYRNDHGPLLRDGSKQTNWKHLYMIQEVLGMNIMDITDDYTSPLFPMDMRFVQRRSTNARDWAGVEGVWHGVFCFCDHRDLLAFNRLNASQEEDTDPSIFQDETFEEAMRALDFELTLVEPDAISRDAPVSTSPRRPTLQFRGNISGTQRIQGYVYVSKDDQVRWTFTSGDPGQTIWSTEAIQIGGTASLFGVFGIWTTVFHDADDPVGPMWLWKFPDRSANTSVTFLN